MNFTFEVEEKIAPLSQRRKDGFRLELNKVSFNNRKSKFDIRSWDEQYQTMQKGITLSDDEARALKEALNDYFK